MAETKYFYGLGRRKSATARARLYAGKGNLTINDQPALEYFDSNKTMLAENLQRVWGEASTVSNNNPNIFRSLITFLQS